MKLIRAELHGYLLGGRVGLDRSYPSFIRVFAGRGGCARPARTAARRTAGRPVAIIEHLAGAETQWAWLELLDPPAPWDG